MRNSRFWEYVTTVYTESSKIYINMKYFLIPSSSENNFIYLFTTPSQTGLNQKQFYVVVESRSILYCSKIVWLQADWLVYWIQRDYDWALTELNTINCRNAFQTLILYQLSDNRSLQDYSQLTFPSLVGLPHRELHCFPSHVGPPHCEKCGSVTFRFFLSGGPTTFLPL